jgi:hypothetical protein
MFISKGNAHLNFVIRLNDSRAKVVRHFLVKSVKEHVFVRVLFHQPVEPFLNAHGGAP